MALKKTLFEKKHCHLVTNLRWLLLPQPLTVIYLTSISVAINFAETVLLQLDGAMSGNSDWRHYYAC